MFYRLTTTILGVILTCLTICSISAQPESKVPTPHEITKVDTVKIVPKDSTFRIPDAHIKAHQQLLQRQDSIRSLLVQETNQYINRKFPKSKLTGEALVMACEKHDFDICFALAQAEIESGLGTAGKAKRTNSPWNVGAYDGRSAQTMNKLGYGYSHPDHSIEPYIELVKTKYLGTRRTIHDLMKRYTTLSGHRYASDPNYERSLARTYRGICLKTTLQDLQEQLKKLS